MLPEKKENMEIYLVITVIAIIVMTVLGYFVGNRGKKGLIENVIKLTAERDVQKTNVKNLEKQIETQKDFYENQMKSQLELIKEQMQTTSEKVLKQRQAELGEENKEQVSKIIDPLKQGTGVEDYRSSPEELEGYAGGA